MYTIDIFVGDRHNKVDGRFERYPLLVNCLAEFDKAEDLLIPIFSTNFVAMNNKEGDSRVPSYLYMMMQRLGIKVEVYTHKYNNQDPIWRDATSFINAYMDCLRALNPQLKISRRVNPFLKICRYTPKRCIELGGTALLAD